MSKELLKQNIEKAQFEIDRKKDMIKVAKCVSITILCRRQDG